MAAPTMDELANKIYDELLPLQQDDPRVVFHQQDIFDLDIIPSNAQGEDDVALAVSVLQKLTNEKLLKVVHDTTMGWKVRSRDEAAKYRGLTTEEELVYGFVDEAGDEGAWIRNIKIRSGIHEAVIQAALKKLKAKNLVSQMKSVEHPTRLLYIKSNLTPSDRATGGPWYTDGELDEALIDTIMKLVFDYVLKRTFYFSKSYGGVGGQKEPKKVVHGKKLSSEEVRAKRDAVLGGEEAMDEKSKRMRIYDKHLPMPAGYQGYPTLHDLTVFIEKSNGFNLTLSSEELKQILDVMVFDDRIEELINGEEPSYRAVRSAMKSEDDKGSVLNEVPCGRCPVFDLCEEGGPVGPSNCEYFNEWLTL